MLQKQLYISLLLLTLLACTDKKDIDKLKFLKKGNIAYASNNLKEAIRFYDEAIAKDSAFVDAWNNKGLALMKQAKYDEAIYAFDMAINYKPDYGEALFNNSQANLAVHQHYAALEHLEALGKIWPDTSVLNFTLGLVHHEMGEDKAALSDFMKAREADSTNAEILVNMANIYFHMHQPDSAIKHIQGALKLAAGQAHAYNILAMVYAYKTDYKDALQAINTAISLDNNDPFFVNNKGYILLKLGLLAEAEENIIQSMKMDPYNGWVYRNLGLLRYAQQNYPEAVRLLEKAMDNDKTIENINIDLARSYYQAGEKQKACEILTGAPVDENLISTRLELCN